MDRRKRLRVDLVVLGSFLYVPISFWDSEFTESLSRVVSLGHEVILLVALNPSLNFLGETNNDS
jgi:hypothetical protein